MSWIWLILRRKRGDTKSGLNANVSVGRMDLDLVDFRSGRGGLPRERDWRVRSISASSIEGVRK